tara:strand:- start:4661 stop:5218 length:558 start_codon:yes stop_codon:yes gene_type:complete
MTPKHYQDHRLIAFVQRFADRIADWSSLIACLVLLWLVGITCVDVVGRYFFNRPLVGATELVRMSMAGIIFFSMPAMLLRDDQVVVDLFKFVRVGWFGWAMTVIISVLTVTASWLVAGRVGKYALRALEDGDETIYLKIPVYVTVFLITALLYLSCVFAGIRGLRALLRPGQILPDETGGTRNGD